MSTVKFFTTFSLSIIALFCAEKAEAACVGSLTQTNAFDMSTVVKPPSGSVTAILSDADSLSGTATQLYGTPVTGTYLFKKTGCSTNDIRVQYDNLSSPTGVTISNVAIKVNGVTYTSFPTAWFDGGANVTNGTGITLYVSATATITSAAAVGAANSSLRIGVQTNNP